MKTTRIRSLGGEQIVMSNTELLKQTVSNYKRLQQRRIVFGFGVTYQTTVEQLKQIPDLLRKIVGESDRLRFDRAHFKAYGESSLDFEVIYIVLQPDYNGYMDEQQRINLRLMEELSSIGVEFAFPTRAVYLASAAPSRVSSDAQHTDRPTSPRAGDLSRPASDRPRLAQHPPPP